MRFPAEALVPSGGEMYCHIFENRHTGLARNLFWSITVDFEPILYGENEFTCSLTCEWIAWPLRNWLELDGRQLNVDYGDGGIESTFYMTEHDLASHTKLALRRRRDNLFEVKVDMLVNFHGHHGGDENPAMPVYAEVDMPFMGLLVVPDNLFPKPTTPSELQQVASEYADLSCYEQPEPWQSHGFIFRPAFNE